MQSDIETYRRSPPLRDSNFGNPLSAEEVSIIDSIFTSLFYMAIFNKTSNKQSYRDI